MKIAKKIKDPIYGYIEVDNSLIKIIDSVYFQRLRNIIQTSYTSIYPSSLHNRFSHSLGVYWLGCLAFDSLINNSGNVLSGIAKETIENVKRTFVFACLCHDLGHSPFSHTGEKFYPKTEISDKLLKLVDDTQYEADLKKECGVKEGAVVGKEHEIMSALLTLCIFGDYIGKENYAFFARCIIGLNYKKLESGIDYLLRACVELLNSSIIDVDKLDYLIRDSYMSGYMTVAIDYQRLLNGLYISKKENYSIGFEKSALSVLEAVLTAHDMERRWVQVHPIILYEDFLLKTIIRELENKYNNDEKKLFSLEALTEVGTSLEEINEIRLLSDSDILYLAKKNYKDSDAVKEYFDRGKRRHPIWKSEAEFKILFSFGHSTYSKFLTTINRWEGQILEGKYGVYSLNEAFYDALSKEVAEAQEALTKQSDKSNISTFNEKLTTLKKELKLLEGIKNYLVEKGLPFDLVIVTQQQFKRNISKPAFKKLPIRFSNIGSDEKCMDEATTIPLDVQDDSGFFYMYYRRKDDEFELDVEDFSKMIMRVAIM